MISLRWAGSLAVLLLAGFLGYRWGASEVESLRAQLALITRTAEEAKAAQGAAQQRIDTQLKAQAESHAVRMAELTKGFEAEKAELDASRGRATGRAQALEAQSGGLRERMARLQERLDRGGADADPALRLQLTQLSEELRQKELQLSQLQGGLRCLDLPVPAESLVALRAAGSSGAAAPARAGSAP